MGLIHDSQQRVDVRSLSLTFRDGHSVGEHQHPWAQLVYARSGLMRVEAEGRLWLVPPTRALWIPAGTPHCFNVRGEVAFRTLYVAPDRAHGICRPTCALEVSRLLAELILHILSIDTLSPGIARQARLANVLVDLINEAPPIDLMLPMPKDQRARRLADHIQLFPGDRRNLQSLTGMVGASVRTLQRHFNAETGIGIDMWRRKARLIASTIPLSNGETVTSAALDSGYDSPSAFIAAFKRQFGMTPRQFAISH